ncbi:MAG: FAD-binding protein [Lachnospiraceae bacterium]|jgi:succinate dehydrogenase/fumarate reductase flavoprotein subunit|nr:FAD-binding protein [Lachnospiraceae bacterium]
MTADRADHYQARLQELKIPEVEKPLKTEYHCDVLVVGCGWAGLNAAVAAKETGSDVIVVDKGTPGFSGMSAFSSSHQWFDADFGDDLDACLKEMQIGNEYIANLDWYRQWAKYSKMIAGRLLEWGILTQYPSGEDSGHYVDGDWRHDDLRGYREEFAVYDRRNKWIETLDRFSIPWLSRIMITDVLEQNGQTVGAIGFHVPSGEIMVFKAKSVILCMGGGSFKPAGFPTGCDSFDSDWIGYRHGLPIVGKEFDDFHFCASYAPGNVLSCNSWQYLENIWLCGGDIREQRIMGRARGITGSLLVPRINACLNGLMPYARTDTVKSTGRGKSSSEDPKDLRIGKWTSPLPKGDAYGAAVGMQLHLGCGIYCGIDDLEGKTSLAGLWVAGDGCNGSCVSGSSYLNSTGFTSNFCSVQGYIAGKAASKYASSSPLTEPSEELLEAERNEILRPLQTKQGFSPNWARDQLAAMMSPYWVTIVKTDRSLRNTLAVIEEFRDEVVPKIIARSPHELRLVHEMYHKTLCAEMKLRASLERKESRGYHYRADYPYRDDHYLCYIAIEKGDEGMRTRQIDIKPEWKGSVGEDYFTRYPVFRFPGESDSEILSRRSAQQTLPDDHLPEKQS